MYIDHAVPEEHVTVREGFMSVFPNKSSDCKSWMLVVQTIDTRYKIHKDSREVFGPFHNRKFASFIGRLLSISTVYYKRSYWITESLLSISNKTLN